MDPTWLYFIEQEIFFNKKTLQIFNKGCWYC